MKDPITGARITVNTDGTAGPYIIVPESLVENILELFESNGVQFVERPGSVKGKNDSDTIFDLGLDADVEVVQTLLDSVK